MAQNESEKPKKKPGKETFKAEDVLQAVIIADSFNERFKPITIRTPRALIPVANCPTIEYTLDFLVGSNVNEIYIFCRAHADTIRNYINNHSYWGPKGRRHRIVLVQVIVSENCYSMGDALREIDSRNLIRSDFILVQGDLIANINLKAALDAHRQRRQGSAKNSIMTLVCRQVAPRHPARSVEEQIVLALEPSTNRVLHHQKMKSKGKVGFPLEVFENQTEIDIRCDLLDCCISICSPQVPPLFSDNFDYLTRDDFIRGILEHEEILGSSIHCFILTTGYTARISNLHMYDVVSHDVTARWVYPLCPDMGFPDGEETAHYKRHHIYHQRNVKLAMGCVLEENVIVGEETTIGENTIVQNAVIGKHCKIGANCVIDGAYIWADCEIGDSCQLGKCVMANGCIVNNNSTVRDGCVFGYDVEIGPNADVPCSTRLIGQKDYELMRTKTEDSESERTSFDFTPASESMLGNAGAVWTFSLSSKQSSDNESAASSTDYEELSWNWITETSRIDADFDDETSSEISESDSVDGAFAEDRARAFFLEISDALFRGITEHVGSENIILEINSSKFANNVTMNQLNKLVIRSIVEIPELRAKEKRRDLKTAVEVLADLKATFKVLLPVLKNYLRSKDSQIDALYSLEDCAINYPELPKHQPYGTFVKESFVKLVHFLYDENIMSEEAILEWHSELSKLHAQKFLPFSLHEGLPVSPRRRHQSGDMSEEEICVLVRKIDALKLKSEPLITWLKEAEEEESDEESDEN